MLYNILFLQGEVEGISLHHRYLFYDAYELTKSLERVFRKRNEVHEVEFNLEDENGTVIYSDGVMRLGSAYANDILDHMIKTLNAMELSAEQKQLKTELIRDLQMEIENSKSPFDEESTAVTVEHESQLEPYIEDEEELEEEYEEETYSSQHPQTENSSNPKKKWKVIAWAVGGITAAGLTFFLATNIFSSNSAGAVDDNHLLKGLQQAAIQQYGNASIEFDKVNYSELDKDSQKAVLFTYLLNGKASKALKYEPKFAESVVAYYVGIDNMKKINEIDVENDIIDFEKASLDKKYDKVISLKDKVSMDGRREKLVAEAYVNLKKYDAGYNYVKQQGNKELAKNIKELEKRDVEQSSLSEEEKKSKIEKIDKDLKEL